MKNLLTRRFAVALLVVMLLVNTVGFNTVSFADGVEKTEVVIDEFTIEHEDGTTGGVFTRWEQIKLKMRFDASYYEDNLKEGDYFTITLPDEMKFPNTYGATHFDVTAADGSVIAKGVVSPGEDKGGTIKVTFTDYVKGRKNIKGNVWLAAKFSNEVQLGETNHIDVTIGGNTTTVDIEVEQGEGPSSEEVFTKWVDKTGTDDQGNPYVRWTMRVNFAKKDLNNVVITDKIMIDGSGDPQGIEFIPGSFEVFQVNVDPATGAPTDWIANYSDEANNNITFSADKTKFTYNISNDVDVSGKTFLIYYNTTRKDGVNLKNEANLKADEGDQSTSSSYTDASSGGSGSGDLLGKIKIIKLDSEDHEIKLSGAEFRVERVDGGGTFSKVYTTDENGEFVTEKLDEGKYTIEEIKAPFGYEITY